jgi:hypothetical protein
MKMDYKDIKHKWFSKAEDLSEEEINELFVTIEFLTKKNEQLLEKLHESDAKMINFREVDLQKSILLNQKENEIESLNKDYLWISNKLNKVIDA